ncbi:GIY-YIG nuclease family protein [Sediminicola luteus]|uniref:Excinuclease ABC subunit C n=1 Tax=Sediminicola luteus TaxID=319238 RepID=A0A2A4GAN7_9FLAO|nr:excinuclease ABC subunit C [Sediminicola luteus]
MEYVVYILFSEKLNKYYVGYTNDLSERIERHNTSRSKYTSRGIPWKLLKVYPCKDRSEAVQLEKVIKGKGARRYMEDKK